MNPPDTNPRFPTDNPDRPVPRPRRRTGRTILGCAAALIALTALFYAEEDWRGRRAFERCKAELQGRGEILDWKAYIPPPIPDDQNVLQGPLLGAYLPLRESSPANGDLRSRVVDDGGWLPPGATNRTANARLTAMTSAEGLETFSESRHKIRPCEVELTIGASPTPLNDPGSKAAFSGSNAAPGLLALARETFGETAWSPQNYLIFLPGPRQPARRVRLALDNEEELNPLKAALGKEGCTLLPATNQAVLELRPMRGAEAGDVLEYFQNFEPEISEIHRELDRPGARLAGDYHPFDVPRANFVRVRVLAQTLQSRALAAIFCGRPDLAAAEIQALFRLAETADTGPATLVGVMICGAVDGIAEGLIETGFQRGIWAAKHWAAFERALRPVDLARKLVQRGMRGERANVLGLFVDSDPGQVEKLVGPSNAEISVWGRFKEKWLSSNGFHLRVAPKGWLLLGAARYARVLQEMIDSFDAPGGAVNPARFVEGMARVEKEYFRKTPADWVMSVAMPNFTKAGNTTARNQTKLNQARIVGGLELFRAAESVYPERLDQLVPKYLDALPRDVILGGEMKYRRAANGYLLYSLGWNGTDDGGDPRQDRDWIWLAAP